MDTKDIVVFFVLLLCYSLILIKCVGNELSKVARELADTQNELLHKLPGELLAKDQLKRNVRQADKDADMLSAAEILTNALTEIIEMKLESYMECNKNEYNHTKCTLKPGPKGEPGDTGPPGIQGIVGQRGPVGPQGLQGAVGPPGKKGTKGELGDMGQKGEPGIRGMKGNLGYPGYKGEKGREGVAGPSGPQGPPGIQGKDGSKGEHGVIGAKGDMGERGLKGDMGPPGPQGETGEKGDMGQKGEGGTKGVKGIQGHTGYKGEIGQKGIAGQRGPVGPKGLQGPEGPPGEKGTKGELGDMGQKGEPGIRGMKGNVGYPGYKGEKGQQGAVGPPGPSGTQGPPGIQGKDGSKGELGAVGAKGDMGERGLKGDMGPPGPQGETGEKGDMGQKGEGGTKGVMGSPGYKGEKGQKGVAGPIGPPGPPCFPTAPTTAPTTSTPTCIQCGGGQWRRVVFFNMTNTSQLCPSGLKLTSYSRRTCGRASSISGSCWSTTFSVGGSQYSRVCGRALAYQFGRSYAFFGYHVSGQGIDAHYVDGLSLTHGASGSRQHIWTFASGMFTGSRSSIWPRYRCPCDNGNTTYRSPPFVGNDYFCESTRTVSNWNESPRRFYPNATLWDGQVCEGGGSCCRFNNPPWFTKNLTNPTTDRIELRLCLTETSAGSDVALQLLELYIQ